MARHSEHKLESGVIRQVLGACGKGGCVWGEEVRCGEMFLQKKLQMQEKLCGGATRAKHAYIEKSPDDGGQDHATRDPWTPQYALHDTKHLESLMAHLFANVSLELPAERSPPMLPQQTMIHPCSTTPFASSSHHRSSSRFSFSVAFTRPHFASSPPSRRVFPRPPIMWTIEVTASVLSVRLR